MYLIEAKSMMLIYQFLFCFVDSALCKIANSITLISINTLFLIKGHTGNIAPKILLFEGCSLILVICLITFPVDNQ